MTKNLGLTFQRLLRVITLFYIQKILFDFVVNARVHF